MAVFETRRSVLFTPGDHERRMVKALTLGADTVCFDLEDAVAPENKETARATIAKVLREQPVPMGGPERCVRINALSSEEWRADLAAAMSGRPDAIMVPKAEDPRAIERLNDALAEAEAAIGVARGQTRLLLIIETALGALKAYDAGVAAGARLGAFLFGAEDLAADVGMIRSRVGTEVLAARQLVALAAGALKVNCLDQVFTDIADVEGLEDEARFARTLGYTGKMAIHPDQIAPIHRAFTPTQHEVDRALRLHHAAQQNKGVFRFEGRMIDQPLVTQAERVLRVARRAGMLPMHEASISDTTGARQ